MSPWQLLDLLFVIKEINKAVINKNKAEVE